ncbi:MAG TPA: LicD family protein [Candidatus Olsenella excrementigallinarum]|nr:LicD family protein [Candidatus Olsenella excrementigallinarum]
MDQGESLHKLQLEELDILLVIDEFCAREGITWFLMSGTALGALRHRGFIPWDDDIDIGMLRRDYDRFIQLAEHGLPSGYSLHTVDNTPGLAGFFAKIYRDGTVFQTAETKEAGCRQAIFVDVFPFDRVSNNEKTRLKQLSHAKMWQRISYLYHSGSITVPHSGVLGSMERLACRVAHHVVRPLVSITAIRQNFDRAVTMTEPAPETPQGYEEGRYTTFAWPYAEPVDLTLLIPTSVATFEGHELPVPARCEDYLENEYGDWRQLPPPELRRTHLPERLVFSDGSEWSQRS